MQYMILGNYADDNNILAEAIKEILRNCYF